jgi:hypothetical protein
MARCFATPSIARRGSITGADVSEPFDYSETKERLLRAPKLTVADRADWEPRQGVYVFWLVSEPAACLKVGIAKRDLKNGKERSISGRLSNHFASNEDNTVFARHLAADSGCPWAAGFDFTNRDDRCRFLATKCVVQMLAIPGVTRSELEAFENYLEDELKPVYRGRVRRR